MQETISLNGKSFNIWYETLNDRKYAIIEADSLTKNQFQSQGNIKKLQTNLITGWTLTTNNGNTATWSTDVPSGSSQSIYISIPGTTPLSGDSGMGISNTFSASSGTTYTLDGWGKVANMDSGCTIGGIVALRFYDGNGNEISHDGLWFSMCNATTWTEQNKSITAPSGTVSANVTIFTWNAYGNFWGAGISVTSGGTQPPTTQPPGTQPPTTQPPWTQPPTSPPGGGGAGCINCDLQDNYCVLGQCIKKSYVLYGGIAFVALFALSILKK